MGVMRRVDAANAAGFDRTMMDMIFDDNGNDGVAFATIVATSSSGQIPQAAWRSMKICKVRSKEPEV
jgi:hypothetical protein